MRLSTTPHPYYPNDWLDIGKAGQLLHQAGLPSRLNVTRCKRDGITYSTTGHIRKISLENYIALKKQSDDAEYSATRPVWPTYPDGTPFKPWIDGPDE